jgi:hypothetical protein
MKSYFKKRENAKTGRMRKDKTLNVYESRFLKYEK